MENRILEQKLNYKFKNPELLERALTHSSYTKENGMKKNMCNERLEFVGDGFLDAVIGSHLFEILPQVDEGKLSKTRASIVCESSLCRVGKSLGVADFLKLSKSEEVRGGRRTASIIADSVEAIIGAIYYDDGYEQAKKTVLFLLDEIIKDALEDRLEADYKSRLQEKLQAGGKGPMIHYEVAKEWGPDHDKNFIMALMIDGVEIAQGTGKKKKEAEQNAAKTALEKGGL